MKRSTICLVLSAVLATAAGLVPAAVADGVRAGQPVLRPGGLVRSVPGQAAPPRKPEKFSSKRPNGHHHRHPGGHHRHPHAVYPRPYSYVWPGTAERQIVSDPARVFVVVPSAGASPSVPPPPGDGGRYELRGDGVTTPFTWVRVAEPPPPPAEPPEPPAVATEDVNERPAPPMEVYRWVDAHGVVHLTDDPATVPAEYRATVRRLGSY